MWFYSIKYYETASDLKHMLRMDEQSAKYLTPTRKQNCLIFRWVMFAFFSFCLILESIASMTWINHPVTSKVLYSIGFTCISILIVAITVLISLALKTFINVVS